MRKAEVLAQPDLEPRQTHTLLIRRFWKSEQNFFEADGEEPTHPVADVDHKPGCDILMEEPGLHGPGIAWRRHLQRKAPESLG
jgi:hypothetical protein